MKYIFQVLVVVTCVTFGYGQSQVEFTNPNVEQVDQQKEQEKHSRSMTEVFAQEAIWKRKASQNPDTREYMAKLSKLYGTLHSRELQLLKPASDLLREQEEITFAMLNNDDEYKKRFKSSVDFRLSKNKKFQALVEKHKEKLKSENGRELKAIEICTILLKTEDKEELEALLLERRTQMRIKPEKQKEMLKYQNIFIKNSPRIQKLQKEERKLRKHIEKEIIPKDTEIIKIKVEIQELKKFIQDITEKNDEPEKQNKTPKRNI